MDQLPKIELVPLVHRGKGIVCLKFEYNKILHERVKQLEGRQWTNTHRSWYVSDRPDLPENLSAFFKGKAWIDISLYKAEQRKSPKIIIEERNIKDESLHEKDLENFVKWMRSRRYSESTIGTYSEALRMFLRYFNKKEIERIDNGDLIEFNNNYILKNNLSASYQNQVVNAVKLFFSTIQKRELHPELVHRPKRAKVLPNVLSKEEVRAILNAHTNTKHKVMLSLIYSCGLRCGEILKLKPEHIDSKRGLLIIKQAKGKKDRIVPLSLKIVEMLREYYIAAKPRLYLFEGQKQGDCYDERSLQNVLKQALVKAGITKPVTLHWLRHSYATHLLESGTDLRYIQEILGHSSSKTTEIYTHVSTKNIQNIVSPFDYL